MTPRVHLLAALNIALLAFAGCTTLNVGKLGITGDDAPPTGASYALEIHSYVSATKTMSEPFHDGMTVQDALTQSGALTFHKNVEIDVLRREGNQWVRMPVEYDVGKRHVKFEQDYALHPDDRVVIRPKTTNPIDAAFNLFGSS